MTQMTVDELLALVKETVYTDYYYKYLDFFGGNEHLRNPSNQGEHVYDPMGREEGKHLKGDEIICGDYLIFEECGHDYRAGVYQCGSLLEIQQHIVGGGSYLNGFTDNTVVIVHGEVKPFVVKGYDRQQNVITHVKHENDALFELHMKCKWVEWLDENQELTEFEKDIQCLSPFEFITIKYSYEDEEKTKFIQTLLPYDQERFLELFDYEMNEKIELAQRFKDGLRKQPES